jgi:hypothetical protein
MNYGTVRVAGRVIFYPEPRGPRVLPAGELVLWYGMFAPCGDLLGTTGFAHGAPFAKPPGDDYFKWENKTRSELKCK